MQLVHSFSLSDRFILSSEIDSKIRLCIANKLKMSFRLFFPNYSLYTHIAPKYLDNIAEIFLGNIERLLKHFETYH